MKALFITSEREDYLQDQMLIGLRNSLGVNLIDYPRKDVLYQNSKLKKTEMYGNGFTIWKSLPDIEIDRSGVMDRMLKKEFDLVIFGSIWRQLEFFKNIVLGNPRRWLTKFVFIDGEDHTKIYWKARLFGKYYKREQLNQFKYGFVRSIAFAIPASKIRKVTPAKTKMFAKHNQCEEAYKLKEVREYCQKSYAFTEEELYYNDIAISRYAFTMKKGGWECMRHYEIAANLSVPCFYNLEEKPESCAPHGLKDMINVVAFRTAEELESKLALIEKENRYDEILSNVRIWVENNGCDALARKFLSETQAWTE